MLSDYCLLCDTFYGFDHCLEISFVIMGSFWVLHFCGDFPCGGNVVLPSLIFSITYFLFV
uniref:Uncharacterized protein n=1 Tax=Rhizophora mucronata TaxID=61149 RepID=A0A2P2Q6Q9_RHIMU